MISVFYAQLFVFTRNYYEVLEKTRQKFLKVAGGSIRWKTFNVNTTSGSLYPDIDTPTIT